MRGCCRVSLGQSRVHQPPRVPVPNMCLPKGWQCALSPTQVSPYPGPQRALPPSRTISEVAQSQSHLCCWRCLYKRDGFCLPRQPFSHRGDVFSYHASCRRELTQSTPQSSKLHISGRDAPCYNWLKLEQALNARD